MSTRERSRYLTTGVVFVLAFCLLGLLLMRSMKAMAQTFTWRPQVGISNTYAGGVAPTQRVNFAFDENLNTAATTYTNADFSGDEGTPDTNFSFSGRWSAFQQTTAFIRNVALYVLRDATGNNADQWEIQYTVQGATAADVDWNEMMRFTITYGSDSGESNLVVGGTVLNTTQVPQDAAFIKSINTGTNTLVLDRYFPGGFTNWATSDNIQDVSGSFTAQVSAFSIDANPTKETVGGALLPSNTDIDGLVAVRTRSKQLINDANANPKLNTYDIRVEAEWDPISGGAFPLMIVTGSLSDGAKNVAYAEEVDAAGGKTDVDGYSWSILSGNLPTGLTGANTGYPNYDYSISGTPTTPGNFTFTLEVTDDSSPPQTAQKEFTIHIAGLAISPSNTNLTAIKNSAYSQTFSAVGGIATYTWCLLSGSLPPGTSGVSGCTATGSSVVLSGTPTNDGVYTFTLRLTDGSTPSETATVTYKLEVKSSGVTLLPKKLKDYIKGINYGSALTDMIPEFIVATTINNVGATAGDIYYVPDDPSATLTPISPLLLSPGGTGAFPNTQSGTLRVNIEGTVAMTQTAKTYPLEIGIRDLSNPAGETDSETYNLRVLNRKTLLLKAPSATATLPSNNQLQFLVFGEGGAPSIDPNPGPCTNTVDGTKVPYYNYVWQVTPVGTAPALGTTTATVPDCGSSQPYSVAITFTDSTGAPVTGTYDITFRAQDVLRRQNASADYEFTPATVRIKVIAPAGQTLEKGTRTGTKLRQEQFR